MTMAKLTKAQQTERDEEIKALRAILKPGATVHTILRHVSKSGMQREIALVYIRRDGEIRYLNYSAAKVLGYRQGKNDGIVVGGCGMDMGFALVYHLGCALWPKGTSKPHGTRNGQPDTSGGYALKHRWL